MIRKEEFLKEISELLEYEGDKLTLDADFRAILDEDWDSLKGFMILSYMETEYNITISADDFLNISTIEYLYSLVSKKEE